MKCSFVIGQLDNRTIKDYKNQSKLVMAEYNYPYFESMKVKKFFYFDQN